MRDGNRAKTVAAASGCRREKQGVYYHRPPQAGRKNGKPEHKKAAHLGGLLAKTDSQS